MSTATETISKSARFEQFHRDNPHVYQLLAHYCREWAKAGHTSFGIRAPWERMRWQVGVQTTTSGGGCWKLNDHLCPWYARLIAAQEPDLAGLLSFRQSEADDWIDDYLARTKHAHDGGLFDLPEQRAHGAYRVDS